MLADIEAAIERAATVGRRAVALHVTQEHLDEMLALVPAWYPIEPGCAPHGGVPTYCGIPVYTDSAGPITVDTISVWCEHCGAHERDTRGRCAECGADRC